MPSYNAVDLDEVSSLPRYCFLYALDIACFSAFSAFILFVCSVSVFFKLHPVERNIMYFLFFCFCQLVLPP